VIAFVEKWFSWKIQFNHTIYLKIFKDPNGPLLEFYLTLRFAGNFIAPESLPTVGERTR
jgi:hypothetical protein